MSLHERNTLDHLPTILVVDDEPTNVQAVAEALRGEYRVLFALSGEEALSTVGSKNVDLILLDVVMPDLDGLAVLSRLKADDSTKAIPVIFVTSVSDEANEAKGLTLGAVDYVVKPIRPSVMRARIHTHLEIRRQRELLERQAFIDSLTGIGNRRRFDREMEARWNAALSNRGTLGLLMIDIDHFKRFNDLYGHTVGDRCLRSVAGVLARTFTAPGDLVCRFGGEEFAVILDTDNSHGLRQRIEHLLHAVSSMEIPHEDSPVAPHITVSAGAVSVPVGSSPGIVDLISLADTLLYQAKEGGRNAGCYKDSQRSEEGCVSIT